LEQRLESCTANFVAIIHCKAFQLNTIGAERINVRIVNEVNAIQVDDTQIWCGRFELVDVDDFLKLKSISVMTEFACTTHINFLFFLLNLLISSNEMQNFESIDKVVDFPHEAFHENDFRQTDAQVTKLCWKSLHLGEIVQLHRSREIQKHVSQVWTFGCKFVENCVRNQLDWQLNVAQR